MSDHAADDYRWVGQLDEIEWSVLKAKHETPCCGQSVRIKTVEPGPQVRKCGLCKQVNVFVLEPMTTIETKLRLRWMSADEVEAMGEDGPDIHDL